MGTSSRINVKVQDKYHSVYCNYDGYPEHVGKVLNVYYNSQELSEKLVSLGDMISLGETIDDTEYYGRDSGESEVGFEISDEPVLNEEYGYIWDGTQWLLDGHYYDENDKIIELNGIPLSEYFKEDTTESYNDATNSTSTDSTEQMDAATYFGCSVKEVIEINNEWSVTFNTPDERMTDEWNARNRWSVRHRNAPYQGIDSDGIWHNTFFGRTLYEAVQRAEEYLQRAKDAEDDMRYGS